MISLDPSTLGEVIADVPRLAEAADAIAAGEELIEDAAERLDAVKEAVEGAPRPRVAALEWLDPVYVGGHWVPQMIELAGGDDVLGMPGERSRVADWSEVGEMRPDVVLSMPCGYYVERAAKESMDQRERLAALGARVVAVDAAAYFSRPGPAPRRGGRAPGPPAPPGPRPGPAEPALDRARSRAALMARKRAERQIVIEDTPERCFRAILEYETFPDWQRAVRGCEVVSRDKRGRGERVEFEIDAKLKTVRYTLEYSYEEPHLVTWTYAGGDVRDVDGELVLEDKGDGTTLATYALRIDPGVWLPGRVADMLSGQVMHGVLEDLKKRVEAPA